MMETKHTDTCSKWVSLAKAVTIRHQKTETRLRLSSCTKPNSKWIGDLNVRPETLKLLQEKIGKALEGIGISNYFRYRHQLSRK
jgi:hypothetical protein